jgi:hypothetical protein
MFTLIEELTFLIEPQISPVCGPLFFTRSLESAVDNITANGSFGLVDTGQKKLLVTCNHVLEEFENRLQNDPELKICVCLDKNPPVLLDLVVPIDRDKRLDLVTIDIERLLPACGARKFYALSQNPAPCVKRGDQLFFVGYPGMWRSTTDEGVFFGRRSYGVNVSSVDDLRFQSDISGANTLFEKEPESSPKAKSDWHGGISGSPCFLVQKDWPPQLVGFTNAYSMNLLWFTHIRCLNRDGTISKLPN